VPQDFMNKRIIAINLPQFHPITENDIWWGRGFTEWTNVVKTKPKFKGHYQPHLPADTGFYDLRLKETREMQAKMAKDNGIYGFCYYHYWFNGKRLLNKPLDSLLKDKTPEFPFMYCWANENWSRRWDGDEQEILIQQKYSLEDDKKHIRWLCEHVFIDKRYIRVNEKPFICIYRPKQIPNSKETLSIWRSEAKKMGFKDLHIGYFQSHNEQFDPKEMGFDVAVAFPPYIGTKLLDIKQKGNFRQSFLNKIKLKSLNSTSIAKKVFLKIKLYKNPYANNTILDYNDLAELAMQQRTPKYNFYPGLMPGWDNSPRRKVGATIIKNTNPLTYEKWLRHTIKNFNPPSEEENFVFITAWNEWAEGNHLEPCIKWGNKFLKVTNDTVREFYSIGKK
jgi:lipopolysaccharide biosynthesis protein